MRDGGLPWSILRATQFHRFAASVLASLTDETGTLAVPSDVCLQPVAADEVAERVIEIALGEPTRRVDCFGGPEVLTLEAMAKLYRTASGVPTQVRTGPVESPMLEAWRSGDQLAPEHADGALTWSQFLARSYGETVQATQKERR